MKNKKRMWAWMLCLMMLGAAVPNRVHAEDAPQSRVIEEAAPEAAESEEAETAVQIEQPSEAEKPIQTTEQPGEEAPETTEAAETTETPETTEAPETTEVPETTETPEVTEAPEATEVPETTETPEPTAMPEATAAPASETEVIRWKQLRLEMNGDTAKLVIGVENAGGAQLSPFAVVLSGDTASWRIEALKLDGASVSRENGKIVLRVEAGKAQGGEVVCGGRKLALILKRIGNTETALTLTALDGNENDVKLKDSADGAIRLRLHLNAKAEAAETAEIAEETEAPETAESVEETEAPETVEDAPEEAKPTEVQTELISNSDAGLTYGDTLELTARVKVEPADAAWSIRWQYSTDGEHFEDIEGANETHYAVTLDSINAQYYWRFVVTLED